ncbi:MAG: VTT domain-containing protein [Spirochaetes bacterium]|nr:VTT domain-containing protein [Spirochaetota bacterium]
MKKHFIFLIVFSVILFILYLIKKYNLIDLNFLISKIYLIKDKKLISFIIIICLYFFSGFIFIPIAQFSIISGFLYGIVLGSLIAYIGSVINIMVAFSFARFVLKEFFDKIKEKIKLFNYIMNQINKNGAFYIFWARLFFITPYNSLNIVSSLSSIKIKDFFLTTVFGAIGQAIFYAYVGSIFIHINEPNFIKILMYKIMIIIAVFFVIYYFFDKVVKKLLIKQKKIT